MDMIQKLLEAKLAARQQQQSNQQTRQALEKIQEAACRIDTDAASGASHAMSFVRTHGDEEIDPWQHVSTIKAQIERIRQGDLSQVEEMLLAQSLTLQTTFNTLVSLGSVLATKPNTADQAIALMQVGLKAQEQSRKTLLALMELKNPKRTTFIKRQVNQVAIRQDGTIAHPPHAHPSPEPRPIQELEASPYATMDTRSEAASEGTDQHLATLEAEYRPHNQNRKAKSKSEQLKDGGL